MTFFLQVMLRGPGGLHLEEYPPPPDPSLVEALVEKNVQEEDEQTGALVKEV